MTITTISDTERELRAEVASNQKNIEYLTTRVVSQAEQIKQQIEEIEQLTQVQECDRIIMQNLTDRHNLLAARAKQDESLLRMAYWYVTSEGGDGSELEALLEQRLGL